MGLLKIVYRAHFDDYRSFISRPEYVAEEATNAGETIVIIHSDLEQFYDRVSPALFSSKLRELKQDGDDDEFFAFAESAFNWQWHPGDSEAAAAYARDAGISDYTRVALPQGLVAAGFFANVVLLTFDQALRESFNKEVAPGVTVRDACRDVDDLRITVSISPGISADEAGQRIAGWLDKTIRH